MEKTITLKTFDALNILFWIESEDSFWNTTKLPIKLQWDMKKNIDVFSEIRNIYNDFYRKVQQKYSDDKYSEEVTTEDGRVDRTVKEEFISEFNKEINDILATDNEVKIRKFNIEDFGSVDIQKRDMDMLSFFIIEEDESGEVE